MRACHWALPLWLSRHSTMWSRANPTTAVCAHSSLCFRRSRSLYVGKDYPDCHKHRGKMRRKGLQNDDMYWYLITYCSLFTDGHTAEDDHAVSVLPGANTLVGEGDQQSTGWVVFAMSTWTHTLYTLNSFSLFFFFAAAEAGFQDISPDVMKKLMAVPIKPSATS